MRVDRNGSDPPMCTCAFVDDAIWVVVRARPKMVIETLIINLMMGLKQTAAVFLFKTSPSAGI